MMKSTPSTDNRSETHLVGAVDELDLDLIDPDPDQPRRQFRRDQLGGLASSIEEVGLMQPIVVRPASGRYLVVAGERRRRAFLLLGRATIPAIVIDPTSPISLLRGAENSARVPLSAVEMLGLVASLHEEGHGATAIARSLGTTRRLISYYLQIARSDSAAAALRSGLSFRRVVASYLSQTADDCPVGRAEPKAPKWEALPSAAARSSRTPSEPDSPALSSIGARRQPGGEPLYERGGVSLYLGDAASVPVPDASVAAVVTSPPWNVAVPYDGYDDDRPWASYFADVDIWTAEIERVLIDGGRAWVSVAPVVACGAYGSRPHSGRTAAPRVRLADRWADALESHGLAVHDEVISYSVRGNGAAWGSWSSPAAPSLRIDHEVWIVASKGVWHRSPPAGLERWRDDLGEWADIASSVWHVRNDPVEGFPAPFSIEAARRAIRLSTWPGELVVDPFSGSATTLVAARNLDRRALGVEISEPACRIAVRRLRSLRYQ